MKEVKKSMADDVKLTDTVKTLATMWKELSPEVREHYKRVAAEDKIRYKRELQQYNGPMRIPNRRQKKPAGAPKRAMSAFLSFSQEKRHLVRQEHPDLKNTEISGKLATLWKNSSEEEKAPHINRELRDREKYHAEMERWRKDLADQKLEEEAEIAREQKHIQHQQQQADANNDSFANMFWVGGLARMDGETPFGWDGNNTNPYQSSRSQQSIRTNQEWYRRPHQYPYNNFVDQTTPPVSSGNYGGPPLPIDPLTYGPYGQQPGTSMPSSSAAPSSSSSRRSDKQSLDQQAFSVPQLKKTRYNKGDKSIHDVSRTPLQATQMNSIHDPSYHYSMITTPAISAYSRVNNDSIGTCDNSGNYISQIPPGGLNQRHGNNPQRQQLLYYDDYRAMQGQATGRSIKFINPTSAPYDGVHYNISNSNEQYSQQSSNIPQSFFNKGVFYKEHSLQAAIHNNANDRSVYTHIPDSSFPAQTSFHNRGDINAAMYNGMVGYGPDSNSSSSSGSGNDTNITDETSNVHTSVNERLSSTISDDLTNLGNTISGNINRSKEGQSALKSLDAVSRAGMFGNYLP